MIYTHNCQTSVLCLTRGLTSLPTSGINLGCYQYLVKIKLINIIIITNTLCVSLFTQSFLPILISSFIIISLHYRNCIVKCILCSRVSNKYIFLKDSPPVISYSGVPRVICTNHNITYLWLYYVACFV